MSYRNSGDPHAPRPNAVGPAAAEAAEITAEPAFDRNNLPVLLKGVADGDAPAFEHLYRQTSARLYGAICRSIWNREEADEVLQETYVKVWRHAADYDEGRSQPMVWLSQIARNAAIDHLRRRQLRAVHEWQDRSASSADDEPSFIEQCPDPAPGPPECLEARQFCDCARALLTGLSALQQSTLLLSYWDGLSQSEIALRLGVPIGTVKSAMRRGLMSLKEKLSPTGLPAHAGRQPIEAVQLKVAPARAAARPGVRRHPAPVAALAA